MNSWSKALLGAMVLGFLASVGCSDDSGDTNGEGDGNGDGDGDNVTTTDDSVVDYGDPITPDKPKGNGQVDLDPCIGDLYYCQSGCVDLTSDEENCGRCLRTCDDGVMCVGGVCGGGGASGNGGAGGAEN